MAASTVVCDSYRLRGISTVKVPPGVVQAQFTKVTVNNEEAASTFKIFKIPKNAVILDIVLQAEAVSSLTISLGDSSSATKFCNGIAATGALTWSLSGGIQGTTNTVSSVGGLGTYYGADDYLLMTTAGATWTADKYFCISMTYFIAEQVQGKLTARNYDSANG